jgi:hypothetical protein
MEIHQPDEKVSNEPAIEAADSTSSRSLPETVNDAGSREAFLASFSPADDKAVMKKVDRRFLLLIGILYLTKTIDYTNAANVKVLQVGQPRNILKELHMTADQYNWVQSLYFVSLRPAFLWRMFQQAGIPRPSVLHFDIPATIAWDEIVIVCNCICCFKVILANVR